MVGLYDPRLITMQFSHEQCAVCECSLKKGDRVWKRANQKNPMGYYCLTCGNSKFEDKKE